MRQLNTNQALQSQKIARDLRGFTTYMYVANTKC